MCEKGKSDKRICINKIIDALKSEIENNDVTKHIEIINFMHQTEITNLNKRLDTQLEMKVSIIKDLEDKVADLKSKLKASEQQLNSKTKEFQYYMKEEANRMKEMEIKLKSQVEKRKEFIAQINPEMREREQKMRDDFEDERNRIKKNYEENLNS